MILRSPTANALFSPQKMGKVSLDAGPHLYAGLNCFEAGQQHKAHAHADQDKLYVVLEGQGEVTLADEQAAVQPGDVILAPAGVMHSMSNPGPGRLIVLVVLAPPPTHG